MKIEYSSSEGIHQSEKAALESMREVFNASQFAQKWQGFAGFEMTDKVHRDREIDLILLTHERLVIVELKNWHGKITLMNDHWLLNGNDMGRSAVKVTADKWKILSSKIKTNLRSPANDVWIDYRVVFCGDEDASALSDDERQWLCRIDDFLKISTPGGYRNFFGAHKANGPLDHFAAFREFFRGPEFRPTVFSFQNFRITGEPLFSHPEKVYKEYRAVKKDDVRHQALLRRWDFSELAGKADTVDERARIALREHQALGYIHEHDEDLDNVVLQPLSHPTRDNVDADFCELYRLPTRQARLSEFVHRYADQLAPSERIGLVKVLLAQFAALHDINVAHRDIADHSVWLERPTRVSVSGFITAYFPEVSTLGGIREVIRAGGVLIPEDVKGLGDGVASDAFRRDVYLLGVVSHFLLYLQWPAKETGDTPIYAWAQHEPDPYGGKLNDWLAKSLDFMPSGRYPNAREMLNALNEIRLDAGSKPGLQMADFEPYRTDLLPHIVYPMEDTIQQGHCHVYRSRLRGQQFIVKIWYSLQPDPSKPEESHRLLAFLEKARLLKAQRCALLPEVIDFGISAPGPFLVQEWVSGSVLQDVLHQERTDADALRLCKSLIEATAHLHGLSLEHGDLSPSNIVLQESAVRFIDVLDIVPGGDRVPCTPAYSPADYESVPFDQRDCFAIAKICGEILDNVGSQRTLDLAPARAEIEKVLSREFQAYRLDRILDAVSASLEPPPQVTRAAYPVYTHRAGMAESLASDNGVYHIGIYIDPKRADGIMLSVSGVRKQVLFRVHPETRNLLWMTVRELQHSEFVANARRAKAVLADADVTLMQSHIDGATELLGALFGLPEIAAEFERLAHPHPEEEEEEAPAAIEGSEPAPETAAIWKAIIEAEEATLPEIEIAGPVQWDPSTAHTLRIPYTTTGEALDFDPEDVIEVLQERDGELQRVGELNTKETSASTLVLDRATPRLRSQVGAILKLRSVQDRSSFVRRRTAVTRILDRESVIPELIDYFDSSRCPAPQDLDRQPTEAELDVYNQYEDGRLVFSLNDQQRAAFRNLWIKGPMGLLQGPPGTGKTAFIASFIHYALSRGAQNILLASQSHEAVNNAAEKVVELGTRTGLSLQLVRFGAEGMVSDKLRPFHSSAILESYRDLFRSEMRARVGTFSPNLGLPRAFVEAWFDVDFHLGRFAREIGKLEKRLSAVTEKSLDHRRLADRIAHRTERLVAIAKEKFGATGDVEPGGIVRRLQDDLIRQHQVRSPDAIARLRSIIAIAEEWVDRLATDRSNFEEFLAKTRTLVCGTCVGIGRSQFGIAKNRYDWVIVDEAARATPSELAVAIQAGRRILLVGDHRQLPPLYTQEVVSHIVRTLRFSDKAFLTRSDFQRAFESRYGERVGAMLQTQYRMAPAIGALVSTCFYPTALAPGRGEPPEWFTLVPKRLSATVTWIDTSPLGKAAYEHKNASHSFENAHEAREIINLLREIASADEFLKHLVSDVDEEDKPIGVICMYADQKRLIQRLFSEQDWATNFRRFVKIDTVDSYQGKQNRLIILSTTRNNARCEQGYVSSIERVNVSISRAMDRLVVIGAARMWRDRNQQSPLGTVLAFIREHLDGKDFQIIECKPGKRQVSA